MIQEAFHAIAACIVLATNTAYIQIHRTSVDVQLDDCPIKSTHPYQEETTTKASEINVSCELLLFFYYFIYLLFFNTPGSKDPGLKTKKNFKT